MKSLVLEVKEWLKSEEGQKEMSAAAERAEATIKELDGRVLTNVLFEPFTI